MNHMAKRILDKVLGYLVLREGCEAAEYSSDAKTDTVVTTVTDSMGYRYEVQVKLVGRLKTDYKADAETPRYHTWSM
jgi:hypothetical protein